MSDNLHFSLRMVCESRKHFCQLFGLLFVLFCFTAGNVEADILSVGNDHACAVKNDGTLACWGSNVDYEGTFIGQATPPEGIFSQVSAVVNSTCALKTDGTMICWGLNYSTNDFPETGPFYQISVGQTVTCGLRADGTVACFKSWGDSSETAPSGTFSQISVGKWHHACGIKTDGTVTCWNHAPPWEDDDYNQYGEANPPNGTFSQVSAGWDHTCGIRSDGTVACWGNNDRNQATSPSGTFSQVSAGSCSCGVRTDGTLACWGTCFYGRPDGTFSQVSVGSDSTYCGVRSNGTVACWGNNNYGQATPPDITVFGYSNQAPPVANFMVSLTQGTAPLTVTLDASDSHDQDGSIVSYTWTINGQLFASVASSEPLSYTFTTAGNYTIVLTVTDNHGLTGTAQQSVSVTAPNQPPVAQLTANPTQGQAPLTVILDPSGSYDPDGTIVQYDWSVNGQPTFPSSDGTDNGKKITLNSPGTYIIALTVTDNDGLTHQTQTAVEVQPVVLTPDIRIEPTTLTFP
jgi:PKD repeat protein